MREWVRRALTRKVTTSRGVSRKVTIEEVPPSERLVLAVYITIAAIAGLTALEIAHLAFLGSWNSEIFSAITGLVGLVVGTLIGAKT